MSDTRTFFFLILVLVLSCFPLFFRTLGWENESVLKAEPHFTAILIVLASSNAPFYRFCRKGWLAIADTAELNGVRLVLLYGKGGLEGEPETPFDLVLSNFVDSTELWGGAQDNTRLVNKTLFALEIIKNRFSFDYIVRTNLHTFWDTARLVERLGALPEANCFAGIRYDWGFPGNQVWSFLVGYSMIFSGDLVEPILLAARENVRRYQEFNEDIALSIIVHEILGVPILDTWYGDPNKNGPLIWFFGTNGNEDIEESDTHFSIRTSMGGLRKAYLVKFTNLLSYNHSLHFFFFLQNKKLLRWLQLERTT